MKPRIMYMELKSGGGYDDRGPARIGRVTFSQSGRMLYYRDLRFQRLKRGQGLACCANYIEIDSEDEYWISGPKKNGQDRHYYGGGPVEIDADARKEYWSEIRGQPERANEGLA